QEPRRREGDDPGRVPEPQGHRDRQGRDATPRRRDRRARAAQGALRHARVPRALRARRAGVGARPAPAVGDRAVSAPRVETAQALAAVAEADAVVCVLDGTSGLLPADADTVRLLAGSRKPVFLAVNKVDGPARDGLLFDFFAAGVDRIFPISAAHGRGVAALL